MFDTDIFKVEILQILSHFYKLLLLSARSLNGYEATLAFWRMRKTSGVAVSDTL